jgi:arylsulfatase
MGYEKPTTPTLDAMAEDGLVFENAIAPGPSTPESMPAIFTGRHPTLLNGGASEPRRDKQERIRKHLRARRTLPEILRDKQYTTLGFTPNPYTSRHYAFDEGFDYFEDFLDSQTQDRLFRLIKRLPVPFARAAVDWILRERSFKPWEAFYQEMISTVHDAQEPYFLWVLLMDTHTPYFTPRRHRAENSWWQMMHSTLKLRTSDFESRLSENVHKNLISAYDDSIRYADEFFERLMNGLAETDPVYLVHSDHGEGFFEHESYYHRRYLYSENIHVPLLISNAGADVRIETPVSLKQLPSIIDSVASGEVGNFPAYFETKADAGITARSREGNRISSQTGSQKMIAEPRGIRWHNVAADPDEQNALGVGGGKVRCLETVGKEFLHENELRAVGDASRQIEGTVL